MPVIKHYANRKLYNLEARKYISLAEIEEMIRQGEEVQVVEHDSEQDITSQIFAQILLDQEKHLGGLLPITLFSRMIQVGGERFSAFCETMRTFQNPQLYFSEEIKRRLQQAVQKGLLSPQEADRLATLLTDPQIAGDAEGIKEASHPEEWLALVQQVDSLEEQLTRLQNKS